MGDFTLGLKVLFRIWGDAEFAGRVSGLLEKDAAAAPRPAAQPSKKEPARSEALTLLAVLQREGRLVDFLMEPVGGFSDAQIGSAVRTVHRDCAAALERLFAIEPLRTEPEGAAIDVPPGYDPAQFHLVGTIHPNQSMRGKLSHAGWNATRCELPEWNGRPEAALVVAPCEVEV